MPVDYYEGIGECHIWGGAKTTLGYPVISLSPRTRLYAHRVIYAEAHGKSLNELDGFVVRHRCDNPSCVNLDHLLIGAQADNMRDKADRNRQIVTPEVRQRMSDAQRRRFAERPMSEDQIEKLRTSRLGRCHSEETKKKLAAAGRKRKATPETKERLRAAWVVRKAQKEQTCPR